MRDILPYLGITLDCFFVMKSVRSVLFRESMEFRINQGKGINRLDK
jgi:hypothetical protein